MKINIVSYEDPDSWICGKIARRLTEGLAKIGEDCVLSRTADVTADVNHHVTYLNYQEQHKGLHTLMVTHIDEASKLGRLKDGLRTAKVAICMSRESVRNLGDWGVDRNCLAFVNPAHDGVAKPRRCVVGITTRLYPDGRKRESDFLRLASGLSSDDFAFKIMGFGWTPIVASLRSRGFTVDYFEEFQYDQYLELLANLDYYLYLSGDEGSMGFVDALASGVKTIVQPQGFHLDAEGGVTHAFNNFEELKGVFSAIAAERRSRINSVGNWTWENYARNHLRIWEAALAGKPMGMDLPPLAATRKSRIKIMKARSELWLNMFVNRSRAVLNLRKDYDCGSRLWQRRRQKKQEK